MNKQEELEQKLYDLAVCNVTDDLGGEFYALDPKKVYELINSEVLSALDQIKKPTMEEVWPSKPYGDSSYEDILKALGWYSKQIESIKNRYKL